MDGLLDSHCLDCVVILNGKTGDLARLLLLKSIGDLLLLFFRSNALQQLSMQNLVLSGLSLDCMSKLLLDLSFFQLQLFGKMSDYQMQMSSTHLEFFRQMLLLESVGLLHVIKHALRVIVLIGEFTAVLHLQMSLLHARAFLEVGKRLLFSRVVMRYEQRFDGFELSSSDSMLLEG